MPKIPGTGDVYTSNTFMLAEAASFDVPSVTPDGGGALISLRDYLALEGTYKPVPTGNSGYEYVSLYGLFSASKLEAMRVIIAAGPEVKGHKNTKWDYTATSQAIWLVDEAQLNELLYENTIMQSFQNVKFTPGMVTSTNNTYGFVLVDKGCIKGALKEFSGASDLKAEGMWLVKILANDTADNDQFRVAFSGKTPTSGCAQFQKFDEIKVSLDGVKYRLFLDGEAGGNEPQYIRGNADAVRTWLEANDGTEVTVGILGYYGKNPEKNRVAGPDGPGTLYDEVEVEVEDEVVIEDESGDNTEEHEDNHTRPVCD